MSTDARLDRLGLSHLKDKPEELMKELDKIMEEYDHRIAIYDKQCKEALKANEPDLAIIVTNAKDALTHGSGTKLGSNRCAEP